MLAKYLGYSDKGFFVWYLILEPGIVCQTGCGNDGLEAKSDNRQHCRLARKLTQSQGRRGHRGCWVVSLVWGTGNSTHTRQQPPLHHSRYPRRFLYVTAAVHDVHHYCDFAERSHV